MSEKDSETENAHPMCLEANTMAADARMEGRWLTQGSAEQCARHCSEIPWRCSFQGVCMHVLPRIRSRPRAQRLGQEPLYAPHSTEARRRRLWCAVCEEWEPGPLELGARLGTLT